MAAPSVGRRSCAGQRETAALISQNRRWNMWNERTKSNCPATVFFFSAAGQNVTYKTELSKFLFCNNYVWETICVFITSHIKMNCFQKRYNFFLRIYFYITIIAVSISVSCLHFGQYSGKFSRTVSSRIFNRVLQPQTGHKIHWYHKNIWKPESASKLYAVKPLNRPP